MHFVKFLSMAFQELKPLFILLWSNPSNKNIFSDLHREDLYGFYSCFRSKCRLDPKRREIFKVTKIQHVKFNVTFADQRHFEPQRYLEGLIVKTNIGRGGRPVPGSSDAGRGGGKRFLIMRSRGASTRVLEDVISRTDDWKTKQVAGWIKDLIHDGPHPTPQPGDYHLGNTDVLVSKYIPPKNGFIPSFATDTAIQITKADISPHYDVLDEIEVPPFTRTSDTCLTFHKLLLIAQCVQNQDVVYSVFRRQDSWFARLILVAMQNEFGLRISNPLGVEDSGKGIRGEERTDFIRVSSSPKSDDSRLPKSASSSSIDNSMWKRIFISNIEERLAQEVLEQFRVQWKIEVSL